MTPEERAEVDKQADRDARLAAAQQPVVEAATEDAARLAAETGAPAEAVQAVADETAAEVALTCREPAPHNARAIMRGTGEVEGAKYEEITYEGYGHGGVAILVATVTMPATVCSHGLPSSSPAAPVRRSGSAARSSA